MSAPFDIELSTPPPYASGASALTPVRLANVAEQVAERLVTAISLGEFVTGQRVLPYANSPHCSLSTKRASAKRCRDWRPRDTCASPADAAAARS